MFDLKKKTERKIEDEINRQALLLEQIEGCKKEYFSSLNDDRYLRRELSALALTGGNTQLMQQLQQKLKFMELRRNELKTRLLPFLEEVLEEERKK